MRLRIVCLLLVLAGALLPAAALPALGMSVNAGLLLIGTVQPTGTEALNPTIADVLGISARFPVAGELYLEPTVDVFTTWYEWVSAEGIAVPSQQEAGPGFLTIGTLVGAQFGIEHALSPAISLGGSIGLDALLRFPIAQPGSDIPASKAGQAAAPAYFFGAGRFFYPETRLSFRWKVSSAISLTVGVRAFFPVFHLWDGLSQPFVDQFMVSGGLGFGFSL